MSKSNEEFIKERLIHYVEESIDKTLSLMDGLRDYVYTWYEKWRREEASYSKLKETHISTLLYLERELTKFIRVEDRLPEDGQDCMFIVRCSSNNYNNHYHGRKLGGRFSVKASSRYQPWEFTVPGIGFDASHWLPMPEAPVINKTEISNNDNT